MVSRPGTPDRPSFLDPLLYKSHEFLAFCWILALRAASGRQARSLKSAASDHSVPV